MDFRPADGWFRSSPEDYKGRKWHKSERRSGKATASGGGAVTSETSSLGRRSSKREDQGEVGDVWAEGSVDLVIMMAGDKDATPLVTRVPGRPNTVTFKQIKQAIPKRTGNCRFVDFSF